jgi:hypothetical protein
MFGTCGGPGRPCERDEDEAARSQQHVAGETVFVALGRQAWRCVMVVPAEEVGEIGDVTIGESATGGHAAHSSGPWPPWD